MLKLKSLLVTSILITFSILLVILNLRIGSVYIEFNEITNFFLNSDSLQKSSEIILNQRLSSIISAMACGISLALSGLLIQTIFQNPLAGPGVLGISSGANLAVAILIVLGGNELGLFSKSTAAILGSLAVMFLLISAIKRIKNIFSILILGLMLSYLAGAGINILLSYADNYQIKDYVNWGFGNFNQLNIQQSTIWLLFTLIFSGFIYLFGKQWTILQLGEIQSKSLGLNTNRLNLISLFATGILTGLATAFCGPIAFIGIASPHITKAFTKSTNFFTIIPLVILTGTSIALFGLFFSKFPIDLPLNAIFSLIGAPVIIYLLIKKNR